MTRLRRRCCGTVRYSRGQALVAMFASGVPYQIERRVRNWVWFGEPIDASDAKHEA